MFNSSVGKKKNILTEPMKLVGLVTILRSTKELQLHGAEKNDLLGCWRDLVIGDD